MKRYADDNNAAGDFYVTAGCCTLCGVPEVEAPDLFDADDTHCWVARQPGTEADLNQMLRVIAIAELKCIRYSGSDHDILRRLIDLDEAGVCDVLQQREE